MKAARTACWGRGMTVCEPCEYTGGTENMIMKKVEVGLMAII